jgi:hypothetical protein
MATKIIIDFLWGFQILFHYFPSVNFPKEFGEFTRIWNTDYSAEIRTEMNSARWHGFGKYVLRFLNQKQNPKEDSDHP